LSPHWYLLGEERISSFLEFDGVAFLVGFNPPCFSVDYFQQSVFVKHFSFLMKFHVIVTKYKEIQGEYFEAKSKLELQSQVN